MQLTETVELILLTLGSMVAVAIVTVVVMDPIAAWHAFMNYGYN